MIHVTRIDTTAEFDRVTWTLEFICDSRSLVEGPPPVRFEGRDLMRRLELAIEQVLFQEDPEKARRKALAETESIIMYNKLLADQSHFERNPFRKDTKKKEKTPMLETIQILKNFDRDAVGLDELVALTATGTALSEAYASHNLAVPDWLTEALRAVRHEVMERSRDFKLRDLAVLRAKLEAKQAETLTTGDLEAKIAALSAELGE